MKKLLMVSAGSVFMALGAVAKGQAIQMVYGDSRPLGNGTAYTWVELDDNNNPLSLGVSFNAAALTGLPSSSTHAHDNATHAHDNATHAHDNATHAHDNATHAHDNATHAHDNATHAHDNATHAHDNATHAHDNATHAHDNATHSHDNATHAHDNGMHAHDPCMQSGDSCTQHHDNGQYPLELMLLTGHPTYEYELLFPQVSSALPFTHMGLNWNDRGHAPDSVFALPHFDFHFYTISPEERHQITAVGDDEAKVYNLPSEEFIGTGYVLAPDSGEPRMGAHLIDPTQPVFNGAIFDETFLYGTYDAEVIFWEPMITRDYLLTQPNMTATIPLPAAYATSGYYPSTYSINYNQANQEYSISLGGLSYNSAPEPEPDYDYDGGWTSPDNHGDACAAH